MLDRVPRDSLAGIRTGLRRSSREPCDARARLENRKHALGALSWSPNAAYVYCSLQLWHITIFLIIGDDPTVRLAGDG